MYKEFYGFRDMPFSADVDRDSNFTYLNRNYEMPLALLIGSLDKGVMLTLVLGSSGVGKTTLINYVRKHIQQDSALALVSGRLQSIQGMLQHTLASFGCPVAMIDTEAMLGKLRDVLNTKFEKQHEQPSLLIIDDADRMSLDALKGVESLLKLNSENSRLLQLVLVGRYTLHDALNTPELQGLLKKVGTLCSLEPLTAEETRHYIGHRLNVAGAAYENPFDDHACSEIYEYSEGIPAKINAICDAALWSSSARLKYEINPAVIREVADGVGQAHTLEPAVARRGSEAPATSGDTRTGRFSYSAFVAGVVFAGVILMFVFGLDRLFPPPEEPQTEVSDKVAERPIERKPMGRMPELAQILQETERPKGLAGRDGIEDGNPKSESLTKTATENLFATAESHLQALRLTTPEGRNALAIYRAILDREPDNENARLGVKRVAEKYREVADRESRQGEFGKASTYLEQAADIFPESEAIQNALVQARKRQDQVETAKIESRETPRVAEKIVGLTEDGEVTKLLATAERQFAASKLVSPEKDNAYETYTAILSVAPNEARAFAGLQGIADRYLELAEKRRSEGKLDQSRIFIGRGLRALPDHKKLTTLRKQIDAELKRQVRRNKIEALAKEAGQQVAALKLNQPPGDNAYKTYQEILAIDKDNQQAVQGMREIQQRFEAQLQDALDKKDLRSAREVAEQVLATQVYGPSDRYHEQVIFAAMETKKIIDNQLENLLSLAERQRKARRLTQPAGDSALESYREILQIDPANEEAKNGLGSLAEQYQAFIREALSDGKTSQAVVIANEGLTAFPDNRDLRALRDNAVFQRDTALKEAEESAARKKSAKRNRGLRPFGNF